MDAVLALLQGLGDRRFNTGRDARPSYWLAALGALVPRAGNAGHDAFLQNRPLEFCKHASDLKHGLAHGSGGVESLGMQIQVDLEGMDFGEEIAQIGDRSAQAINAPGHNDIEFPARGGLAEGIELRALIAPLGT